MFEPRNFPSLDSCQKRFLWTHKEADLALHPVVGLVLKAGYAEKFFQALGFKSLDPFFSISKHSPCFTAMKEDGNVTCYRINPFPAWGYKRSLAKYTLCNLHLAIQRLI